MFRSTANRFTTLLWKRSAVLHMAHGAAIMRLERTTGRTLIPTVPTATAYAWTSSAAFHSSSAEKGVMGYIARSYGVGHPLTRLLLISDALSLWESIFLNMRG